MTHRTRYVRGCLAWHHPRPRLSRSTDRVVTATRWCVHDVAAEHTEHNSERSSACGAAQVRNYEDPPRVAEFDPRGGTDWGHRRNSAIPRLSTKASMSKYQPPSLSSANSLTMSETELGLSVRLCSCEATLKVAVALTRGAARSSQLMRRIETFAASRHCLSRSPIRRRDRSLPRPPERLPRRDRIEQFGDGQFEVGVSIQKKTASGWRCSTAVIIETSACTGYPLHPLLLLDDQTICRTFGTTVSLPQCSGSGTEEITMDCASA